MNASLQRGNKTPLYLQLSKILKQRILKGEWNSGDTLPSEIDLCDEFGVARGTVRQALGELESAGYIQRSQGRGTTIIWGNENRRPKNASSNQIGFVVPYVRDSFVSTILLGMERSAAEKGWSITFKHVDNDFEQQTTAIESLVAEKVAGIVVYPVDSVHIQPMAQLIHSGYPVVLVDRYLRGFVSDYVTSDNFGGALRATQHLIQLGHERIGFLSWRDPAISIEHRIAGYQRALVEADIPYDLALTCEIEAYPVIETDPLCAFLRQNPRVTAILAANDQIALAVYKAVRAEGIRIPEDLALVGFDNLDFTSHLDVPLTTVAQSPYRIGQVAVEILAERVQDQTGQHRQVILPTELIVRRSCGAHLKNLYLADGR